LDETKSRSFKESRQWESLRDQFKVFVPKDENSPKGKQTSNSFSGHERNRMFFQTDDNFDDVSLISGTDLIEDSRGFVWLDFDNDGWVDLAVTSPMQPRFRLFRNAMGDEVDASRSISISLVGGNETGSPSEEFSNRDAVGAILLVKTGETERIFQVGRGEGLASQNSKWVHIGVGSAEQIDELKVVWPSGKITEAADIESGVRVTLFENGDNPKFQTAP
jgi:hypothetical protein